MGTAVRWEKSAVANTDDFKYRVLKIMIIPIIYVFISYFFVFLVFIAYIYVKNMKKKFWSVQWHIKKL